MGLASPCCWVPRKARIGRRRRSHTPAWIKERPTRGVRRRQIAIVSSLTGYHGMATCPSYSASKACVKAWGAGLRGSLARRGIQVSVICPGFVRSRITDRNTCPMPFFMEADEAADVIIARLSRNIGLIAFPWPMRLAMWVVSALPERLSAWLFSRLPEKA